MSEYEYEYIKGRGWVLQLEKSFHLLTRKDLSESQRKRLRELSDPDAVLRIGMHLTPNPDDWNELQIANAHKYACTDTCCRHYFNSAIKKLKESWLNATTNKERFDATMKFFKAL